VNGKWWYSTGAYSFGCHAKLELSANGTCVVVDVVDNGPSPWVEKKAANACGGNGYTIDASPLVTKALFGFSCTGWSDCAEIQVRTVDGSTPTGPTTCSSGDSAVCGNTDCETGEDCTSCPSDCTCDPTCSYGTTGNNGDSCVGVSAETWRCVYSSRLGDDVSQVCRNGKWLSYHVSPKDCSSCCGSYSSSCS